MGGTIKAIEIKFNSTFRPEFTKNLDYFHKLASDSECYLVYNGTQEGKFLDTFLIPLQQIDQLLK